MIEISEKLSREDRELLAAARKAVVDNSGKYPVGAALRCRSGAIYTGVNIYCLHGPCAESIALGSAVSAGESSFDCIVAVDKNGDILSPCGNCRQMLIDTAPDCRVIIMTEDGEEKFTVKELLPYAYDLFRHIEQD